MVSSAPATTCAERERMYERTYDSDVARWRKRSAREEVWKGTGPTPTRAPPRTNGRQQDALQKRAAHQNTHRVKCPSPILQNGDWRVGPQGTGR